MQARSGYVESYMQCRKQKIIDTYLSIDIREKTGDEQIPIELKRYLENTTTYLGLVDFFEDCVDKEIWITDDVIRFEEQHDVEYVMHAILEKDIIVHLCVSKDKIEENKAYLDDLLEENSSENMLIHEWIYDDDMNVLQIMKRLPDHSQYILRLYEEGNGVIVYSGQANCRIAYFEIPQSMCTKICNQVVQKVEYIIKNPEDVKEDSRYYANPVHMKYGLLWKYPNAGKCLSEYCVYEDREYAKDEYEIKLAKQLLEIPEVNEIWLKLHE